MRFPLSKSFIASLMLAIVYLFNNAALAIEPYKNGKQLLIENSEISGKENGFFVSVPVDYNDLTKGTTEIYVHFRSPYNPNLPTYAFFTGGPGQSSHFPSGGKADMYGNLGYNFLLFDQRGIAFSRPEVEQLWKNPDFHSSENNARDLEEIRKFLKIDKISIYGASYGTVPATIYGNLFPKSARSVVLEGVVFDGFDMTPQHSKFLPTTAQKYFDSLPPALKEKLNRISDDVILPKMWVPAYIQAYLQFSGTQQLAALTTLLEGAAKVEDKNFLNEFTRLQTIAHEGIIFPKSLDENLVHFLLMGKEFGFTRTDVITQLVLENGKIVRQKTGMASGYVNEARNLGMPLDKKSTYIASDYPLSVPTYYINGSHDGATIAPWAIKHWKSVPKAASYLLILKGGGHMPGGQILRSDTNEKNVTGQQAEYFFNHIFKKMLDGNPIFQTDINELNGKGIAKMVFTSKNISFKKCQKLF
ncbi:MAG: alpha/beta fold hydrolase [Pseudobdellovibrionaceae bacterium]